MSFKRDGNDGSWLKSLQKRRVSELLTEDIPVGEAHLMKNGKFACMVCNHRPVFDTVDMLSVHRNGKKHAASVVYKEVEAEELEQLKIARAHQQYVETGYIDPSLSWILDDMQSKPDSKGILGAKPYDSRVKKRPNQRRKVLDLSEKPESSLSANEAVIPPQTIADYRKRKHMGTSNEPFQIRPYKKKENPIESQQPNLDKVLVTKSKHTQNPISLNQRTAASSSNSMCSHSRPTAHPRHTLSSTSSTSKVIHHDTDIITQQKREQREKYFQAIASGWKKDRGGEWVKDDDVEFDSDDEPPNIP